MIDQDALLRMLTDAVPDLARRSVETPVVRLGTVETFDGEGTATVTLDGDLYPVAVAVAVASGVFPAQRVAVLFYPPHGALVAGVLGSTPGEQVWTSSWTTPTDPLVSASPTAWTHATPDGAGGFSDDAGTLVCEIPGWWNVNLSGAFASNGTGTHRAFGLRSTGTAPDLNASAQFAGGAGVPTTGFGLSLSVANALPFEVGDVLSLESRQDATAADLSTSARLHLRWISPLR